MRKFVFLVLIFLFFIVFGCKSTKIHKVEPKTRFDLIQFNSKNHDRIYNIQVSNYQNLELIDLTNGSFNGKLIHSIFVANKKGNIKDSVTQKINIPELIVEKLILNLKVNDLENLKTCDKVENCITGLDGTTIVFKSEKTGSYNSASYWQLESDYFYNQKKVKLPEEVKKARKLLAIISKEIDLKVQFQNFLNRLPRGDYLFNMIVMKKR